MHPCPLPGLLTEVKAAANHRQAVHEIKEVLSHQGSFPLHHVEAVHDRSSPVIPQDAHVGQVRSMHSAPWSRQASTHLAAWSPALASRSLTVSLFELSQHPSSATWLL